MRAQRCPLLDKKLFIVTQYADMYSLQKCNRGLTQLSSLRTVKSKTMQDEQTLNFISGDGVFAMLGKRLW